MNTYSSDLLNIELGPAKGYLGQSEGIHLYQYQSSSRCRHLTGRRFDPLVLEMVLPPRLKWLGWSPWDASLMIYWSQRTLTRIGKRQYTDERRHWRMFCPITFRWQAQTRVLPPRFLLCSYIAGRLSMVYCMLVEIKTPLSIVHGPKSYIVSF